MSIGSNFLFILFLHGFSTEFIKCCDRSEMNADKHKQLIKLSQFSGTFVLSFVSFAMDVYFTF